MKQGGEPRLSATMLNDPNNAAALLKGDEEELEQLDEDHVRSDT